MTLLRTGPELRPCAICHIEGRAPEIVPYLGREGHVWAHPVCARSAYAAKALTAVQHESNDGV